MAESRASFVPPTAQRELRDLTCHRTTLVAERARIVNRLQKVFEDANLKLAAVATEVMGISARAILEALLAGESDPHALAALARGQLRAKREQLEQALTGRLRPHHCFLLTEHLRHIDYLDEAIAHFTEEIAKRLHAEEEAIERLDTIPGMSRRSTEILLAEIGSDLTRFPSARHLASWAGMCPGNHESAGKRKSGRTRKGDPWLRTALVEAAQAAGRGSKRAAVAVGHSILGIVYHLLTRETVYEDLGVHHFDERHRRTVERRLVRRLEALGYKVAL